MRIVIDPGHGGRDPGATVGGKSEAVIVLPYAFALASELTTRGHTVGFTRTANVDLAPEATWPSPGKARDLTRRAGLANRHPRADVFLSLHCNAAAASAANGAWVIYDDGTRTGDELALEVFRELAKIGGIVDRDAAIEVYPDRSPWVGGRELYVISETEMPAILIELGFMTNGDDLRQLEQTETKCAVARAIADGVETWNRTLR